MRGLFAVGFAIMLLSVLLLQNALPVICVAKSELAYDSGTAGGSVFLPYNQQMWKGGQQEKEEPYIWTGTSMLAVGFTSTSNITQILVGVRFYVTGELESFNVWLLDSNQAFLTYGQLAQQSTASEVVSDVYEWTVTPNSTGWVYVNVLSVIFPIFVTGDFYVAMQPTAANGTGPALGLDTTGIRSNRSWVVENQTSWVAYSEYARQHGLPDGNLMIRAVLSPIYDLSGTTSTATSQFAATSEQLAVVMLLAIIAAAVVGLLLLVKHVTHREP